jgi:hypothetical protein
MEGDAEAGCLYPALFNYGRCDLTVDWNHEVLYTVSSCGQP